MTYPIQAGKVQAPALRDETLARTRLLDWLDVKIHRRVLFVIADAGYGKTTLLADFSRRTRLRTIWYRLDEDDRDWVGFLAHLVAAGREHDPDFAPRTAAILRSLEPGGPTREDAIETFLEELPSIANDGAALILDDFHLADEVTDIKSIAREIVVRGPERLSIVFASRRPPAIPVSKLRSLGELAELGIADLRFSDIEMEQLFRDTYGRPLEPDVLAELAKRTEGWAASLTLVQAALRERTPAETRSFVRSLSGARDELHDYLAEEVVGDLPQVQQQFLMRTSILQRVTAELAQVASGLDAVEVQSMIAEAERLGLLGRRAKRRSAEQRYHPLVREFLEDRLRRDVGPGGVEALHVAVATWAEPSDWQVAAYHWSSAGRADDVLRVIEGSLETIVASGAFATAQDLYGGAPDGPATSAAVEVIRSRVASREGDLDRVVFHASRAAALDPSNDVVVMNVIATHVLSGNMTEARTLARELAAHGTSGLMKRVAIAVTVLLGAANDGDLLDATRTFTSLAEESRDNSHGHFEGVSELNAAICFIPMGAFREAATRAQRAIDILATTSSGNELKSAQFAKATALAHAGDLEAARALFAEAGVAARNFVRLELLHEHSDTEAQLGSAQEAARLRRDLRHLSAGPMRPQRAMVDAMLALRRFEPAEAIDVLSEIDVSEPATFPGLASRALSLRALALAMINDPLAESAAEHAVDHSAHQRATLWELVAMLAQSASQPSMSGVIRTIPAELTCAVSIAAELVLANVARLDSSARAVVVREAIALPDRWLPSIRGLLQVSGGPTRSALAALLSDVGTRSDIALLADIGRAKGASPTERRLPRELARRLAEPVVVNDLGRVTIAIGEKTIGGQDVRRKVLSLLVYLLTKPRFSATREEVMEAMWPDMDPSAAINSLNQSVYFLRRVFEPEYAEDSSAGYVRQDSDLLWLDTDLVDSASRTCARLVAEHERTASTHVAVRLSEAYTEKFALDFTYEEWASDYRDWLHVSCLRILEGQIRTFLDAGDYEAGIAMVRRAILTDPRNEDLEVSLLRLLRGAGAHAAAAEQYAHYALIVRRDLGVEPPEAEDV